VMMVSTLRVTCFRDRPVSTAVSPTKCLFIGNYSGGVVSLSTARGEHRMWRWSAAT
jgi:hypothetical protein